MSLDGITRDETEAALRAAGWQDIEWTGNTVYGYAGDVMVYVWCPGGGCVEFCVGDLVPVKDYPHSEPRKTMERRKDIKAVTLQRAPAPDEVRRMQQEGGDDGR